MNSAPEEKTINNWKEFCNFCNELQGYTSGTTDKWIFRGHRNIDWKLMSSLHREVIKRGADPLKIKYSGSSTSNFSTSKVFKPFVPKGSAE